jgi:4-diphosphocytidyl-2C-methyl-D-erythritol kinase
VSPASAIARRSTGCRLNRAVSDALKKAEQHSSRTAATALGTGTGAILTPLLPLPARAVVLELADFAVSSKDAFGWFAADRGGRPYTGTPALLPSPPTWDALRAHAQNDLEAPVFTRHPTLVQRREAMEQAGMVSPMQSNGNREVLAPARDQ